MSEYKHVMKSEDLEKGAAKRFESDIANLSQSLIDNPPIFMINGKPMETINEQKPLTKHIQTAVNAIHKQIDKYTNEVYKLTAKAKKAEEAAEELREAIQGLQEQISKLKGE